MDISISIEGSYSQNQDGSWIARARIFTNGQYDPEEDYYSELLRTKEEAIERLEELKTAFTLALKDHPDMKDVEIEVNYQKTPSPQVMH